MSKNEWQDFFDGYASRYMGECFTKNTVAEVDFLVEEMKLSVGNSILDIGCGTGRHSVELAKRGFCVTGVDISTGMLAEAKKAAGEAGVRVEWIQCDATKFQTKKVFGAAICLCEGSFGLLSGQDDPIEHESKTLRNICGALKPGGLFILTALNACKMIRQHQQKDVEAGKFDPITLVVTGSMELETPEGKKSIRTRERGFVATELTILLRQAGFAVRHIWGGTAGNWGRRPLDLDEFEIMVTAEKPE